MNGSPYTINFSKLGIPVNKDLVRKDILSLYAVRQAGSTHGTSIFATRNINKDEIIIKAVGPVVGEDVSDTLYSSYAIDVLVQIGLKKWILPNNETRFLNHSCEPNMGIKPAGTFVAMRNIKAGEELTYDYSINEINDTNYSWEIDCLCGTKSCRERISNVDIFRKDLNLPKKYKGYLPRFTLREIKRRGMF